MRDIRSIGTDGRAVLEDGTEVQFCVGNAGELRARAVELADHLGKVDQYDQGPVRIQAPSELLRGLDQS